MITTISPLNSITRIAAYLLRDLAQTHPLHPAACLLPRLADEIDGAARADDTDYVAALISEENSATLHEATGVILDRAAKGDPAALGAFVALFPEVDEVIIHTARPSEAVPSLNRKARRAALSRSASRR